VADAIAFDGSILGAGPPTGVARAFLTTLRAYLDVANTRCVLLLPDHVPAAVLPTPLAERIDVARVPGGNAARQLRWPKLLRDLRASLLHAPIAAIPWRAPCPTIATVHDLPWRSPIPLPREPGRGVRARIAVNVALRRARAIVVPSAATAADLAAQAGARRVRIAVVPHGVAPPVVAVIDASRAPPSDAPFLFLGDMRPRKNVDRLLRAHKMARAMDDTLPLLRRAGPGQAEGFVDEATKSDWLTRCRALVHVTLFEGFGLPVLEGFAHGAPVVAADIAALREIGGDAALFVDPQDEAAIAKALVRVHRDDALRSTMIANGHRIAAAHGPERSAAAWLALHDEIRGTHSCEGAR
jgi:glycosyltransferase involved in cell wall biosynthesis